MDAIVLDGDQRSALALIRSLGGKGIRVTVGAEKTPSLSSCSRYCAGSFVYASPYRDPVGFLKNLMDFVSKSGNSILFPMTDVTLTEILVHRNEMPGNTILPFVDLDRYLAVTDKSRLMNLANDLNVPIPTTFVSTNYESRQQLLDTVRRYGFPVVVKPAFSKIRTGTGWLDASVRYAKDEQDLLHILSEQIFHQFPFVIQERIEGPGVGIFLLMANGEVIARFAHRRIREKPPSGGVSVLCESVEMPSEAFHAAVKIFRKLQWTGVAMVEFKVDIRQNIPKLLEVNARFWGSLQLAVSAGVDFPYLLYRLANNERIDVPDGFTVGLRSRWELGDLDHLLIRLFKDPKSVHLPLNYPSRMTVLKDFFCDFFRSSVKNEVLRISDPKPFVYELKNYVHHMFEV